jgi:predicted Zn-dependent peptidase
MLSNAIGDRFFNAMRTENELGYYVRAGVIHIDTMGANNMFLKFEIQTQDEKIVDIVREYVDRELIGIINAFTEDDLDSGIRNMIDHIFKDPSNMSEKYGLARSINSDLTYDELEQVGESVFLNRLRSLDTLTELKNLTLQYVQRLLRNAILNNPRYVVTIMPSDKN